MKSVLLSAVALMGVVSAPGQSGKPAEPSQQQTQPPRLPYGVEEVLKLTRAKVGEEVIVSYIQTSGTVYNLSPDNIVYLKNEGVSETVINKMLEQRRLAIAQAEQKVAVAPGTSAQQSDTGTNPPQNPPAPAYAPAYAQQPPVVVHPPSTVHVVPYPTYGYPYYPYYRPYRPHFGYYGGWWGPSISFGFGFGGGHHHWRCR